MKLVIATIIHRRYELTYAFLRAMERLRNDFGIETYVGVTKEWNKFLERWEPDPCRELLDFYGFKYIEHENHPLGKKFNAAVNLLRDVDFTHMMILGSDDIPSSGFIEAALDQDPNNEYDVMGIDALWFWGMNPRRAGFNRFGYFPVKGVLAGPGKIVSRRALEMVDYAPWPDEKNYAMDAGMMSNIRTTFRKEGVPCKMKKWSIRDNGGFLVDIKYQKHISSLSPILRREDPELFEEKFRYVEQDPHEVLPEHLSEQECNYLFALMDDVKKEYAEKQKK